MKQMLMYTCLFQTYGGFIIITVERLGGGVGPSCRAEKKSNIFQASLKNSHGADNRDFPK